MGKLRIDRPFSAYTAEELENLLWRRCKAELTYQRLHRQWFNPSPGHLQPQYAIPFTNVKWVHLVPGGRWLLLSVAEKPSSVLCCDLDNPTTESHWLIPGEQNVVDYNALSIDVDPSSLISQFQFLYASYPDALKDSSPDDRRSKLQVWMVSTAPETNTNGSKSYRLRAKRLSSFLQEPAGPIVSTSLRGNHLALSFKFNGRYRNIITNWRKISGSNYPKRILHNHNNVGLFSHSLSSSSFVLICEFSFLVTPSFFTILPFRVTRRWVWSVKVLGTANCH